jgi:cytochrome bd-type quinol oxidase subunit 2
MIQRTVSTRPSDVTVVADADQTARPRIKWGAVLAGMVLAVALLVLLSSLWFALAFDSNEGTIRDNLEWFVGGSAIVCVLIGGFAAGRLSGVPGAGPGLAHGLTLWAVTLLIVLAIGIPSVINVLNLGRIATQLDEGAGLIAQGVNSSLWTTFIVIVGALAAAALGGLLGGLTRRDRTWPVAPATTEPRRIVTRDADDVDTVEVHEERV